MPFDPLMFTLLVNFIKVSLLATLRWNTTSDDMQAGHHKKINVYKSHLVGQSGIAVDIIILLQHLSYFLYWALLLLYSILPVEPVDWLPSNQAFVVAKQVQIMKAPPPCLTVGVRYLCWCAGWFSPITTHTLWPNISTSVEAAQKNKFSFGKSSKWAIFVQSCGL